MSEEWPTESRSTKEVLQSLTEKDYMIIALEATVAQQAQMIEHLRGGPTPLYTAVDMANAAADGFRDGAASVVVDIDLEEWPTSLANQIKRAIEAAGGRVKE